MMTKRSRPVIAVTGASQGIGAAIARAFASAYPGCRLALVARSAANLARVARQCRGAEAEAFACDVSDAAAVNAMAKAVTRRFGTVDLVVNNAGKYAGGTFLDTDAALFDHMVCANLRSAFLVSRAFAPAMVRRGRGDLLFMSSVAGLGAYPGACAYTAAKFGVTGLAKVLRVELKDTGVRVGCVYPGATVSPSWKGSGANEERMMPAEDVARAFVAMYGMTRNTVIEDLVLKPLRDL